MNVLTWVLCLSVVVGSLSTTGCAGLLVRRIETGGQGNYAVLKHSIPPLPPWKGRLFVYMVGGGPSIILTSGIEERCSVDSRMCKIMGKSYWYIDLGPGHHKVTTDLGIGFGYARYGKQAVEFDLKTNETKYCRMNLDGPITPEIVDAAIAEPELANLDYMKHFMTPGLVR